MPRELTDKVINEIVEAQMNRVKEENPGNLINYDSLKRCLIEAAGGYLDEKEELNNRVDYELLHNIEKKSNTNKKVFTRLINSIRDFYGIPKRAELKNRNLLELHGVAMENIRKKDPYSRIPNYGHATHSLLTNYLQEKGLIKRD